jgi:hypothetical protein
MINVDALTATADANTFGVGTSAYYDTFSGLIPCIVLEVTERCYGFRVGPRNTVKFRLTADRGAYRKGEELTADAFRVPPRKMIRRLQYSNRIQPWYSYVPKTPA